MSIATIFRIVTASVIFFFFTSFGTSQDMDRLGPSLVPANAAAFVHVHVGEMVRTPGLTVPAKIAAGVQEEADRLFERHLGIRISELQELTFVLPTVESMMAAQSGQNFEGFALMTFTRPYDQKTIKASLDENWEFAEIENMYVNKDKQLILFMHSDRTLALGNTEGLAWLLDNRNESKGGLSPALQLAGSGHITVGLNGRAVPSQIKYMAPIEFRSLVNADALALSLKFSKGIHARARMDFSSSEESSEAAELMKEYIDRGRSELKKAERKTKFGLDSKEFGDALVQLVTLAMIRHGETILDEVRIETKANRVEAEANIEGIDGPSIVIVCLTAIQAIGQSSEEKFQSISNGLRK